MSRIFFPLLLLFLLFVLGLFLFIHGDIKSLTSQFSAKSSIGFYPGKALFYSLFEFLLSLTIFSPIFFSLKQQSFIKSVISSVKLSWKDLPSLLPLFLLTATFYLILHLFFAQTSPLLLLMIIPTEYLTLLIGMSAIVYYQKKYTLPSLAESENARPVVKRNIFLRRIGAFFIDKVLILFYAIYVASLLADSMTGSASLPHYFHLDIGLWIILSIAILYPILSEWLVGGTLGKLALGIRVRDVNKNPITFFQSLIRNIFRIVDAFPYVFPYLVGLITIAASEKKQRLGDMAAKTIVVQHDDTKLFSFRSSWLLLFFFLAILTPPLLHATLGITATPPTQTGSPTTSVTPDPDFFVYKAEIDPWKEYRNSAGGYSVSYPPTLLYQRNTWQGEKASQITQFHLNNNLVTSTTFIRIDITPDDNIAAYKHTYETNGMRFCEGDKCRVTPIMKGKVTENGITADQYTLEEKPDTIHVETLFTTNGRNFHVSAEYAKTFPAMHDLLNRLWSTIKVAETVNQKTR